MVEEEKRGDVEQVGRIWWTGISKDVFPAGAGTILSDILDVLLFQLGTVVDI